jgi:hypothetical protein
MKCLFSDELFAKKNSYKDALEIVFSERVTKTENIKTDATKILRLTLFSD